MIANVNIIDFFIKYVGFWGGVVWMPILGYLLGEMLESLLSGGKKPTKGGGLGLLVGLGFWVLLILPRLLYLR
jgi:hypothetical protein